MIKAIIHKFIINFFIGLGLSWAAIFPVFADNNANTEKVDTSNLYFELGQQKGLESLTDAFIQRIAQDKQIMPYFAKSSVKHFKKGFISHLCDVSDGPCQYDGDSMVDIHTGMNVNEADFNRVVELLVLAMEDVGIGYTTQNKLLAKLAKMRGDIIKL